MLRKIYSILSYTLLGYLVAVMVLWTPLVYAESAGTTIFQRNGNPDLLYSILNGYTQVGKNVTLDSTTMFINMNTPPVLIAKYSPLLGEGRIAIMWIHDFMTPQNYNRWVNYVKQKGEWDNTWYAIKALDPDGVWRYKAVLFHIITPKEAFSPIKAANGKVYFDGKILGDIKYQKLESCAANNLSSAYCSSKDFKAGTQTFFDIVSAIAKRYNVDSGFVVVQRTSTHTVKKKKHHGFKTKVTIKVYLDSYPEYYMLVPIWTPGVNTPTAGFVANGMGYLKVDPSTAQGWDWSKGSILVYEKSKSGWDGIVGIALGVLAIGTGQLELLGANLLSSTLTVLGATYTAYATTRVSVFGNAGTFHGLFKYNKLSDSLNSDASRSAAHKDFLYWENASFGHEFDGSKTVLSVQNNLSSLKQAGLPVTRPMSGHEIFKLEQMQKHGYVH